jgi:hypothetical protein
VTATDLLKRLESGARQLSPRRRRWHRFLSSLPIDPDRFTSGIESPTERDFIICGCPRTGTSLLSAVLYQPPSVVTVMEPWDGMRFPPAALFSSLRREIDETGRLTRGRLDTRALTVEGKVEWRREGFIQELQDLHETYLLGVKWPGFWRYLDLLPNTKFLVCVRHPAEVIASFKTAGGRVAEGLNYDTRFNRSMNEYLSTATNDVAVRRILLFDYIHTRILPHIGKSNVFVVRYDRWFTKRELLMEELSDFLGVPLKVGHPRIRPPRSGPDPAGEEMTLLRRYCTTSEQLGYPLVAED